MLIQYNNSKPCNGNFREKFELILNVKVDFLKPEILVEGLNYIIKKYTLLNGEPLTPEPCIKGSANRIAKKFLTVGLNKKNKNYVGHQLSRNDLCNSNREDGDYILNLEGIVEYSEKE